MCCLSGLRKHLLCALLISSLVCVKRGVLIFILESVIKEVKILQGETQSSVEEVISLTMRGGRFIVHASFFTNVPADKTLTGSESPVG